MGSLEAPLVRFSSHLAMGLQFHEAWQLCFSLLISGEGRLLGGFLLLHTVLRTCPFFAIPPRPPLFSSP